MKLNKGIYYITDPCYLVPDNNDEYDMWIKWLDENNYFNDADEYTLEDIKCFVSPTAYGDGSYSVSQSKKKIGTFGVDSGLFGVFPVELIEKLGQIQKLEKDVLSGLATKIKLDKSTEIIENNLGYIDFGEYSINTR